METDLHSDWVATTGNDTKIVPRTNPSQRDSRG